MRRESIYSRYKPLVDPGKTQDNPAYWFIFNSDKLLINLDSSLKIPFIKDMDEINLTPIRKHYIGILAGYPCYCAEVDPETIPDDGMEFIDLRLVYDILDEDLIY